LHRSILAVLLFATASVPCERLHAQENRTTRTLTVGATVVDFADVGGTIPAVLTQFSIDRGYSQVLGYELSAFLLVPLGGATAIPECIPNVPCETRSTPSLLFGGFGSLIARGGDAGLRAALGIGPVWSTGGEGLSNSSSFAGIVGVDWVAAGSRALTLSARLIFLESAIGGARLLFMPSIGVTF
jgi:hypothetical protein